MTEIPEIPEAVPTYGGADVPSPKHMAEADGHQWDTLTTDQQMAYRHRYHASVADRAIQSDRPIPESVTHDELMAALEPLYALLNVNGYEVYDQLIISGREVTFTVVAPEASIPSTTRYGLYGELGVFCSVKVEQ